MSLITPRMRKRRLSLEALEDRTVPSTVTSNLDSGPGSLRDAIASSSSGDTINFASSLQGQTITLKGQLDLSHNLSIVGPGANELTISGNSASRVFDVRNSATVTLAGLTIANGSVTADESATFGGGGILNEAGSTLTLSQCALNNNKATAASNTVDVFGGGLLNLGSATVSSCTLSGNEARGGGGTSFFGGSCGGAIDNYGGATLAVTSCSFSSNQALGAGSGNFGIGGAIENNAALDQAHPSTATISTSVFTGNVASGSAGVVGNGGALDNEGPGVSMTVSSSAFLDNHAVAGSGADGIGGAILNYKSKLTVTNSSFTGNEALGRGSGKSGQGGAILNDLDTGSAASVSATIINCTFTENRAAGSAGGVGYGGALFNGGSQGILAVSDSTLSGNSADGGGEIANESSTLVRLNNTIVANSTLGDDLFLGVNSGGSFTGSNNLIGDGRGLYLFPHSLAGNPFLASLGDYGGPAVGAPGATAVLQSEALLPGSPAIDAGSNSLTVDAEGRPLTTDPRGQPRTVNGTVDIGAFESQGFSLGFVSGNHQTAPVGTAFNPLVVSVTANNPLEPVNGGHVFFHVHPASDGAGAVLSSSTPTIGNGQASVTATANSVIGSCGVSASGGGAASPITFQLTATQARTSTRITSTISQSEYGRRVTLTAVVRAAAPSKAVPAGTLTFKAGNLVLGRVALVYGLARLLTPALPVGTDSITAVYNGNEDFARSTSAAQSLTVHPASTTTKLATSSASAAFGQAVRFTATVKRVAPGAGAPTGTVTFYDGATVLRKASLVKGVAQFTTTSLSRGRHRITAVFSQDSDFLRSTSAILTQAVS